MCAEIRFAHLSDWHATTLVGAGAEILNPKRLSGWASWRLSRRHRHDPSILEAAIRDVHRQQVDRILVTGDLTHISLEQEFRVAAAQLATLGSADDVFLIPGNHDCYVPVDPARSWDLWAPYLAGANVGELDPEIANCLHTPLDDSRAPRHEDYPILRLEGRLAMVGLCSAIPTPIFRAGGLLGDEQLDRLERLLEALRARGYCRVLMIHHPVAEKGEPTRRALWDADRLREVLSRVGAELVIHGHKHRRRVSQLPGPQGGIPSVGVPSSSEIGSRPEKRAQYHVYTVRSQGGDGASTQGFEIDVEVRGHDAVTGEFGRVDDRIF